MDLYCLVTQLCPTLCDPMSCSPPGSSVHGISQASILEWVVISYSRESSQLGDRSHVSHKSPALQVDSLLLSLWGIHGFVFPALKLFASITIYEFTEILIHHHSILQSIESD